MEGDDFFNTNKVEYPKIFHLELLYLSKFKTSYEYNLHRVSKVSFEDFKNSILNDYKLGRISREMSCLGRREVLTGKAKFGIFGDGKELPQLAMARVFRNGDFRSGYYRDQTFALAIQAVSVESFSHSFMQIQV